MIKPIIAVAVSASIACSFFPRLRFDIQQTEHMAPCQDPHARGHDIHTYVNEAASRRVPHWACLLQVEISVTISMTPAYGPGRAQRQGFALLPVWFCPRHDDWSHVTFGGSCNQRSRAGINYSLKRPRDNLGSSTAGDAQIQSTSKVRRPGHETGNRRSEPQASKAAQAG